MGIYDRIYPKRGLPGKTVDPYGGDQHLADSHPLYDLRHGRIFRYGASQLETVAERQKYTDFAPIFFRLLFHMPHQLSLIHI